MLDCTEVENGKPYLVNVKLQTEFKWENEFLDIFCSLNSDHKFRSNDWETNLQCGFSSFPNINADFSEEVNSAFETFLKEYSYFSSQKLYHVAAEASYVPTDFSTDDWIERFIKRKWSSGLLWAGGAAEKKTSQLP